MYRKGNVGMPYSNNTDKRNISPIACWVAALVFMIIMIAIVILQYSDIFSEHLQETGKKQAVMQVQQYADRIKSNLQLLNEDKDSISYIIFNTGSSDDLTMVRSAVASGNAYMAVICNSDGIGIDQEGERVDLSGFSYFTDIVRKSSYEDMFYVPDDNITGENAFVTAGEIRTDTRTEYILIYYAASNISRYLNGTQCGENAYFLLIDPDGNVMQTSGKTDYKVGSSLGENIERTNGDRVSYQIKKRISAGVAEAVEYLDSDSTEKVLVYCPVKVNNWYLVASLDDAYVDRQMTVLHKDMKDLIGGLIKLIVIFSGITVFMAVLLSIRSNRDTSELREKADTDLLTSLNNKLATERKIREYMLSHPEEQGVMMLLDIDNFKKINDTLGHAFGDEVLRSLGNHIGSVFRVTDIIGRTGGDEFMIFLKKMDSDEIICREAGKAADFFDNFEAGGYVKYSATASIGVAVYPREGNNFEKLYKSADEALYEAKRCGKNQIAFHDPKLGKMYTEMTEKMIRNKLNGTGIG